MSTLFLPLAIGLSFFFVFLNYVVGSPAPRAVTAQGGVDFATPTPVVNTAASPGDDQVECRGTLQPGSFRNVVVPPDTSCVLSSLSIAGNLWVEPGGGLTATGTQIGGNVTSRGLLSLTNSLVRGHVNLQPACGGIPSFVSNSRIDGGLLLERGCGGFQLTNTSVGGNVLLREVEQTINVSPDLLVGNQIAGHLQSHDRFGIQLRETSVAGNASIWQLFGTGHQAVNNRIGGQLQAFNNAGFDSLSGNSVGGSLDFMGNTGGSHAVNRSTIGGNLRCDQNTPPAVVADNSVAGQVTC